MLRTVFRHLVLQPKCTLLGGLCTHSGGNCHHNERELSVFSAVWQVKASLQRSGTDKLSLIQPGFGYLGTGGLCSAVYGVGNPRRTLMVTSALRFLFQHCPVLLIPAASALHLCLWEERGLVSELTLVVCHCWSLFLHRKPSVDSFKAFGQCRIVQHNEESSPQMGLVMQLTCILGF